ncbi:MAG: hypothetical protein ACOY3F_00790 [Bacillota bacterium]
MAGCSTDAGSPTSRLFQELLETCRDFVPPGEMHALQAELGSDQEALSAAAGMLALMGHPLGKARLEDASRR